MPTILVVDDSAADRAIAGACIQKLGLSVAFANDGRQALECIAREQPSAVLTDLNMPEVDGLELIRQVRRKHSALPVILMTAMGSEETAVEALHAGAVSYVPKRDLQRILPDALRPVLAAVESGELRDQARQFLEESETRFVLGYEPNGPQALISYLQDNLTRLNFCDRTKLLQIGTALGEAITNALDHGNLELDSQMRESGDNSYRLLGNERSQQQPYCDRRVHVACQLTPAKAAFIISDEGPGFDPSTLPDPTDPENLLKSSGRGIMLMRSFLDTVEFNDKGNQITMIVRQDD